MITSPKVSIVIITYNHERFIAQALDSVLMQRVDFAFEIVVGEDCSTDATRKIVCEYQRRFPDLIRLQLLERNEGAMSNALQAMAVCEGEYMAFLEGDDYWTSTQKLQIQVDFLDAHHDFCGCFHNVAVVQDGQTEHLYHRNPLKEVFTLRDIVSDNMIPTCSAMFRRHLFPRLPEWFSGMPMGDWPMHVLNAEHGNYGYLNEVMAAYRIHEGGSWSMKKKIDLLRKSIAAMERYNEYLQYRFDRVVRKSMAMKMYEIALSLLDEGDRKGALCHAWAAVKTAPGYPKLYQRICSRLLYPALFNRPRAHMIDTRDR
jgi:glycosyltransferase involved in cell wall biosynthesis